MRSITRRIFRERRRLSILAVLAAMSGYLFYQGDPRMIHGLPLPLVASLTFAAALCAVALVSAVVATATRFAFEAYAIAMLVYAILTTYYPALALERAPMPLANIFVFLIGTQVIYNAIYGDWLGRFFKLRLHVDRATSLSALPREVLWRALTPDPRDTGGYCDPTMDAVEAVPGQPDTLRLTHDFGGGLFKERIGQFEQVKPGWAYRMRYAITGATPPPQGRTYRQTLALDPRDGHTAIHMRWERPAYPLNKALMHWIDDWAGRRLDEMVNIAEARYREAAAGEPLPAE